MAQSQSQLRAHEIVAEPTSASFATNDPVSGAVSLAQNIVPIGFGFTQQVKHDL